MKQLIFIITTFVLLSMVLSMASCSDDDPAKKPPETIVLSAEEARAAESANEIAFELFGRFYSEEENSVVFSPLSTQMALAMLANGASGATLDDFQSRLFPGISLNDLNSYYNKLYTKLPVTDGSSRVCIANSVWHNDDLILTPDYEQTVGYSFGAPSYSFNPANKQAAAESINDWVSKATDGKIPGMLSSGDVGAFNLITALYFKSEWANKFDKSKTKTDVFHNIDGTKSAAPFMNGKMSIRMGHIPGNAEEGLVAEFSFGNDAFRMVFVKPGEDDTPAQAIERVKNQGSVFFNNLKEYEVTVRIPRFDARTKIDLEKILAAMGFEKAMSSNAEYINLCSAHAFAKKIIHECCIEVDEDGATAAAATSVSGELLAPAPKYFILDRPFAYMIREASTGAILFMGAVNRM